MFILTIKSNDPQKIRQYLTELGKDFIKSNCIGHLGEENSDYEYTFIPLQPWIYMFDFLQEAGIYYSHVPNNYDPLPGERIFRYKWTYLPTKVSGTNSIVALANDIFPLINRWNQGENWKYELI